MTLATTLYSSSAGFCLGFSSRREWGARGEVEGKMTIAEPRITVVILQAFFIHSEKFYNGIDILKLGRSGGMLPREIFNL